MRLAHLNHKPQAVNRSLRIEKLWMAGTEFPPAQRECSDIADVWFVKRRYKAQRFRQSSLQTAPQVINIIG